MQKYYINILSPYTHNICIGTFYNGGEKGIWTPDKVASIHAFQACSFDHSDISPLNVYTKLFYHKYLLITIIIVSNTIRHNIFLLKIYLYLLLLFSSKNLTRSSEHSLSYSHLTSTKEFNLLLSSKLITDPHAPISLLKVPI